jgi:monofunctional glycosyltransferase
VKFFLRALAGALVTVLSVPVVLTLAYGVIDPPSLPVLRRHYAGERAVQTWVPLADVSPDVVRAVVISEDARFCMHWGVDLNQLRQVALEVMDGEQPRGASTITMQVVRNIFLWPERSYLRKAIEVPLAMFVDFVLSKDRILEIYLNVAQWGPVQYGVEAGAQRAFGRPAADVTGEDALALATVLPAPGARNPSHPSPHQRALMANLERQLDQAPWVFTCLPERIQP